jgi:Na+/H+-dicarboxylate symporter
MTNLTQRISQVNGIIVPLMFIAGIIAAIVGVGSLATGSFGGITGLLLLFGGMAAIAIALILALLMEIALHLAIVRTQLKSLELLTDVADHLQGMRAQMGKGVFGLLGQ